MTRGGIAGSSHSPHDKWGAGQGEQTEDTVATERNNVTHVGQRFFFPLPLTISHRKTVSAMISPHTSVEYLHPFHCVDFDHM